MGLRCGIVGLPNVGKSTLFNALTAASVPAENYPFCTIEPNAGIVAVPDARLAALDAIVHSARVLPATVELVDIAGLVRGASKGEGLGNQFLAHIRETHAIVMVLRCFEDPDVTHVDGSVEPLRDAATIETELALADLDTVERRLERVRRAAKTPGKEGDTARAELALLEGLSAHLSAGEAARSFAVPDDARAAFRDLHLLTAKPVLYVANVDEAGLRASAEAEKVESYASERGAGAVRLCAKLEAELAELASDEKAAFLAELGLEEPGLDRLARAAYALLDLITFFTAGPKEVRAWTIRRGTAAPQAAGEIHTDFERTFIRAEVIPFDDYVACGGEVGARAKGKMRVEGKEYLIQDGDVLHFRVGA
jgi:GTP-binding protein YchF